jgi:DnaJ family protein B protein 4
MTDHYSALGLRSDAPAADIKKAFRKQSLLWHPDKARHADAEFARAMWQEIQQAYEDNFDPNDIFNMFFGGGIHQ